MWPLTRQRDRRRFFSLSRWTPANLTSYVWLDAADASTITLNGSTVSQWADKSGNGRNATQVTAAYQPLYSATAINNKAAIVTDGVDDALYVASWGIVSPPFTRAFVFNPVTIINGSHYINNQKLELNGSFNLADYASSTSATAQYAGFIANGVSTAANTNYIRISEFATTTSRVYMNGVVTGPSNSGNTALRGLCIGGISYDGSGAVTSACNTRFGEVLVIPGVLSTDSRQRLEGYLAWKWGLQSSLPVSHPYYSVPPLA